MQAKDVMTQPVITVKKETTVAELIHLLLERRISGVPVVDEQGRVVGIVTEGDLILRERGAAPRSFLKSLFGDPERLAREYIKLHGCCAQDVMTQEVITVEEETPLERVAALMADKQVNRLPVLRQGKLVGIVTRADVLKGLAQELEAAQQREAQALPDQAVAAKVMGELRAQSWARGSIAVSVAQGVVHLSGLVSSEVEKAAAEIAARGLPGVRAVVNNIVVSRELPLAGE